MEIRKNYKKEDFFKEIYSKFQITETMFINNFKALNHQKKLEEMTIQRLIFSSMISMAEIYIGFPIYFLNKVDYRLRIYPWSYLFSRTTGVYKHLLKDYKMEKLDNSGF